MANRQMLLRMVEDKLQDLMVDWSLDEINEVCPECWRPTIYNLGDAPCRCDELSQTIV